MSSGIRATRSTGRANRHLQQGLLPPFARLIRERRMAAITPINTLMQILRVLSVVCTLTLSGCVSLWHVDSSSQGSLDIFHLHHSHGLFFPFMIGEDDLYLYLSMRSQQEGNTFPIPSSSGRASLCRYEHPMKHCTDHVEGEIVILRVSDHWVELSISLSASPEHSMPPWSCTGVGPFEGSALRYQVVRGE